MTSDHVEPSIDQGFSQKVLRYFLTFLQTDFKKLQAPRRRIQLTSDVGFRMGMPLRKYSSLYKAIWKFADESPEKGLQFEIGPRQYTAPISPILRDLVRQHVDAIESETVSRVVTATVEYASARRGQAADDAERFVETVQVQFVDEVGKRIIQPLLAILDGPFRQAAYSAIESIYEVEADLTDAVAASALEQLPPAVNTLVRSGDTVPLRSVLSEFFVPNDIRARIHTFFDDFATSDAFQELRDLQHSLRSAENQSLYLYLCDIRFGPHAFPLFYVPLTLDYKEEDRRYSLEFDPHLLINKQAVDWILQEREGAAAKLPISPVTDRILYLDGRHSFLDEMEAVFSRLIPSLELAAEIRLRTGMLQQVSSPTLKLSTSAYFAVFDKADEALINDYEELLAAFSEEQKGASRLFDNIIKGFISDDPPSVTAVVDAAWQAMGIPDRLVANLPVPVNEEQRKILSALNEPTCNYVSVQGPPGTGKSHTITALAFEGILRGQSVLILSDKTEALDVVQDKLESVLARVRYGDEDFPNPILRLGRSGNTFNRLVSSSAQVKIKTHFQAAQQHADRLERDAHETFAALKSDISKTVATLSDISLNELDELHRLEAQIGATSPCLLPSLQTPNAPTQVDSLGKIAAALDSSASAEILLRIYDPNERAAMAIVIPKLIAWETAAHLAEKLGSVESLSLFGAIEAHHHPALLRFIGEYESLRMPLFGFLFRGRAVQDLNTRVGATLPCSDPVDLHKRLPDLKQATRTLGLIREGLGRDGLEAYSGLAYRFLRDGQASQRGVAALSLLLRTFVTVFVGDAEGTDRAIGAKTLRSVDELLVLITRTCRYALLWRNISSRLAALPQTDYVGTKTRLERLNTARMTGEIDRRFLDFVDKKRATVKAIAGVIKGKQKFPEEEFHHLSDAFPVIIAGIREYAEYVPLKQRLFDLVIVDEASQVSVAQALPAVLRAKKVVVFGDAKQFSNVKAAQASNIINTGHLTDIEAYFRANVSEATTKLQRLKHFDVKKSILEFFDLIANYQTMLRKHFRGYQELIGFSSKYFYDGQLQAIKIRSKPLQDVIRFEILGDVPESATKNTNRAEAEFILTELRRMVDEEDGLTVGVITPFREQVKLLNEVLFRDTYGERFDSDLRLKIMTFDTCQGEERDLIIFSMVATSRRDVLNYVFPVDLKNIDQEVDGTLKAQRLNVGFSRGKEAFLFVLSKPVEEFKGSIQRVLMHYQSVLAARSHPDESSVDPASPMERKVLDWIYKTQFYQMHEEQVEVVPQFPIGKYLKQLDPSYSHPEYRCDFLIRLYNGAGSLNVIIEYDGFAEHFVERHKIHSANWDRYYKPEDVERQMIIESYGYKFLRLNRFNLGNDPVVTLSSRLYELADKASTGPSDPPVVVSIRDDAVSIEDGSKKTCPKCQTLREIQDFWDPRLKSGNGGYGRNCMKCKPRPGRKVRRRRSRRGWQ
jgi:hypothetical protein